MNVEVEEMINLLSRLEALTRSAILDVTARHVISRLGKVPG